MLIRELIQIDNNRSQNKFLQIVDSVAASISSGQLKVGDSLPSINQVIQEFSVSRDTVFKAYSELKERGLVKSVQNKGYYVTSDEKKVFLLLDTMKAYKEVLYGEFHKSIPANYSYTVQFHHYNFGAFQNFVSEANGSYVKYIIMPFNDPRIKNTLSGIPKEKLLILDWKINEKSCSNVLYQDFGQGFYDCLEDALPLIKKYDELILLYPEFTNHPHDTVDYFIKFCKDSELKHSVQYDSKELDIKKGKAYISVSDRLLGKSLEQAKIKELEFGKDVGFISYNETPMKQFINKGITVISTDFKALGRKAAEFVTIDKPMDLKVQTSLKIRKSL